MESYFRCPGKCQVPEVIHKSCEEGRIGELGLLRLRFLQANKPTYYATLLFNGELEEHLLSVEATTRMQTELLLQRLLKTNPVPPGANRSVLTQHMHSLRLIAEEAAKKEIVLQ